MTPNIDQKNEKHFSCPYNMEIITDSGTILQSLCNFTIYAGMKFFCQAVPMLCDANDMLACMYMTCTSAFSVLLSDSDILMEFSLVYCLLSIPPSNNHDCHSMHQLCVLAHTHKNIFAALCCILLLYRPDMNGSRSLQALESLLLTLHHA